MPYVAMLFLVPDSLASPEKGRHLLERFMASFPRHIPEKYGDIEPLEHVFDEGDLGRTLQNWGTWAFVAEHRSRPWSLINIQPYLNVPHRPHRGVSIHLELEEITDTNIRPVCDFVYDISNAFGAVYSSAQMSPRRLDVVRGIVASPQEHTSVHKMIKWTQTVRLRRFIMNLFWLTVFGPAYVDLFGRDRILAAPAYNVQLLPYGGIGMQLTTRIEDTEESKQDFETTRRLVQQHLDSNAFYDKDLPQDHVYSTPDFGIPKDWPANRKAWREKGMAELAAGEGPAHDALKSVLPPHRRSK
jgi:hypothetical protein